MQIIKVILTALLSVASLFIITKIMGHKQVAQLDFFDYVSGITIGSIGAELATELEKPYKPLIALAIYGLASLLLNLLAHKIPRTRKYIILINTVCATKHSMSSAVRATKFIFSTHIFLSPSFFPLLLFLFAHSSLLSCKIKSRKLHKNSTGARLIVSLASTL